MNDIEERLTRTFSTVAEQTTPQSDWDRVVRDADSAAFASSSLRPRVLAIAAMLAIVIGAGVFVVNSQEDSNQVDATQLSPFVLPGEEVLSLDPLTVRPGPTPEPRFDTSGLGTEVVVEQLTELDWETERSIEFLTNTREGASITKLTFLGLVDGSAYVQLVTDGPDQFRNTAGNVREVFVIGPSGYGGAGNAADADSTEFLIPSGGRMSRSSGPGGPVIWAVPPGTAAVRFTSDDNAMWTRPSGGYAMFPTGLDDGEEFTLQAFDVNGDVVLEKSTVVQFDPEAAIGDPFDLAAPNPFVLPGETVLSLDPLTVTPAPSPEPRFDTLGLGEEIVVEPLVEIDERTQMMIDGYTMEGPARTTTKITLLGTVGSGPYVQVITDGPDPQQPDNGNLRSKTVFGDSGGFGSGDWVDPTSTDLIGDTSAFSDGFTYSTPAGDVVWEVPARTAVATFESDDSKLWIRPMGGYAVFPIEFFDGETVTVRAFDADGTLIDSYSQVIRFDDGS